MSSSSATSAGALRGNDYDTALCQQISELTGAPAVSTIGAVREAIEAAGATRIGVITPYVDELNEKIKASIEADGVIVARVPGADIVDFAVSALGGLAASGAIELVFASCTNFGAMAARAVIAERLGVPVVTSNQAVLDAALVRLNAVAA